MGSQTERPPVQWVLPDDLTRTILTYAVSVARRTGARVDLADDIAQVTLIRLNDAAARNPEVLSLLGSQRWRGYVATSTRNILAGHHRSEARRLRREASSAEDHERLSAELDELANLEVAMVIEQAAACLSPDERTFVHLRYVQGLTVREIAEQMGRTDSVAWHLGHGAIQKLLEHFERA